MQLRNSTKWSDRFLRRMVAWVCRQIEMPVGTVRIAEFRNGSTVAMSGRAYYGQRRIIVSINPQPAAYPTREPLGNEFRDALEALVGVTAHECYHLAARYVDAHRQATRRHGRHASNERVTTAEEFRVVGLFRMDRFALFTAWSAEPAATARVVKSAQQRRADKASAALARWQRKAKLAATKVRQYRKRVSYYQRTLGQAAKGP